MRSHKRKIMKELIKALDSYFETNQSEELEKVKDEYLAAKDAIAENFTQQKDILFEIDGLENEIEGLTADLADLDLEQDENNKHLKSFVSYLPADIRASLIKNPEQLTLF